MTHLREARQKNALNTKAFSDPPTQRKKSLLKEHFCTPSHFSLYGLTSYLMMSVECNSNCKLEKSVSLESVREHVYVLGVGCEVWVGGVTYIVTATLPGATDNQPLMK